MLNQITNLNPIGLFILLAIAVEFCMIGHYIVRKADIRGWEFFVLTRVIPVLLTLAIWYFAQPFVGMLREGFVYLGWR